MLAYLCTRFEVQKQGIKKKKKTRGIEYNRVAKDARSEPCIECLLRGVPNRFRLAKKTITMRDFSQAIARGSV